jgi:branched-chain amino acid transport system permease protein
VRLRPLYLAVATLALAQTFDETLFHTHWLANAGQQMTAARPSWLAGDHAFAVTTVVGVGLLFAFTSGFARSRTGRALRAVRDNPRAASAAGINPVKYRLVAFTFSAFAAGLMGALLAYTLGAYTSEEFSFFVLSLSAFGLAMVGGVRSPLGAVVGAFALIAGSEPLRGLATLQDWVTVTVGVGIVVVMTRNPDGLVGAVQQVVSRLRPPGAVATTELRPVLAGGDARVG